MSRENRIYARLAECYGELPAGGLRRVLALWGFAPAPFHAAFGEKEVYGGDSPGRLRPANSRGPRGSCGSRRAGR